MEKYLGYHRQFHVVQTINILPSYYFIFYFQTFFDRSHFLLEVFALFFAELAQIIWEEVQMRNAF